jgi:hypothetical protein
MLACFSDNFCSYWAPTSSFVDLLSDWLNDSAAFLLEKREDSPVKEFSPVTLESKRIFLGRKESNVEVRKDEVETAMLAGFLFILKNSILRGLPPSWFNSLKYL